MSLSDDQKQQLVALYGQASQSGDTASMARIKTALQADRDAAANNPAFSGTNQYFDLGSMSIKTRANNSLDTFSAGMGQRFVQAGQAVKQAAMGPADVYDPESGQTVHNSAAAQNEADLAEQGRLDAPLNASTAGKAGNMAGSAAIASAVPGSGLAAAAGGGALAGATMPGDEGGLKGAAIGAAGGAAGYGVGSVLGAAGSRLLNPLGRVLSAQKQAAVDFLKSNGIDLDLAQQTGSRIAKTIGNAAEDNPVLGPTKFGDTQRSQFTNAVLRQMGIDGATDASAPVMSQGRQALKNTYNAVAARTSISVDLTKPFSDPLLSDLNAISNQAKRVLTPDNYSVVSTQLKNIVNAVKQGAGRIGGEQYQNIQSELGQVAADGGKGNFIPMIRQALTRAVQRANPQDAALIAETNQRYAAMKAIQGAIDEHDQVSPSMLFNSLDRVKNQNATVFGDGPNQQLVQLAQAGKLIMGRGTPNSGTIQRGLGQLAVGAVASELTGAPGEIQSHTGANPWLAHFAAAIGGAALGRAVMQNPKVANAMAGYAKSRGILTAEDATKALSQYAGQSAGANVPQVTAQ